MMTGRALSNGALRFFTAQTTIFAIIDDAVENPKIKVCAMENLSTPLDRARRVMLGTRFGTFGTCS